MNNFRIGASAATTVCIVFVRLLFTSMPEKLPVPLGFLDLLAVLIGSLFAVFAAFEFVLKRYPDTKEMLPLFSGIVWTVLVSSYAVLRYQPEYQTSLSILVTGVFVGMGWWIQAITTAANSRRSHTLNIIMASRTSSEYQQQTRASSKLYLNSVIPPEFAEWKFQPSKEEFKHARITDEVRDAINGTVYVLNYFEFLAQGLKYRDLDACLLRECFSDILAGLERRGFHLIIEAQKGSPKSFEGLLQLAKEWNGESIVERYRSNPDNTAIGPRWPDQETVNCMIDCRKTPAVQPGQEEAHHPAPALATTDGVPVTPPGA
ncbi:TPA: DUF4760 domain-containing protein [Pseudomonas aeruginosa]|uniref:DUF4760 domain-containing protein n=1 Tax=Pseudomonas aeruginosa TaxID=287 RepID=UPI000F5421BE|nr:DUF4760 domain-containing protein [Pseudomonas aeruginosa]EIU1666285.1 DUF4760 domain-containing protein [Pseudomonas aeruginosa]EMC2533535.1 DUF4760 domain-containing protein [Pseudomonas aeruginosa]MBU5958340.1 DUF4760 domain-containing protein [Pseudomonas aeruginosa]MCO7651251.1 DUF4760 domain-containing protein [Pseudomonas aeruginosa]MDU0741234.1 DUF4760 domain-containing protein [Pseudomonas aeruginosa]